MKRISNGQIMVWAACIAFILVTIACVIAPNSYDNGAESPPVEEHQDNGSSPFHPASEYLGSSKGSSSIPQGKDDLEGEDTIYSVEHEDTDRDVY